MSAFNPESADIDRAKKPVQPPLFEIRNGGSFGPELSSPGPLETTSPLETARYWYWRYLKQDGRPENTVKSYLYDLRIFQEVSGNKPINLYSRRDIAKYLGDANTRSTRKRRLTSASGFFKWLVNIERRLDKDPTETFYPEFIPLKTPRPLFQNEQELFLNASVEDSSRSALMCWLMLRTGLSRQELLQLRRSHLDFSEPRHTTIYVQYDEARNAAKERKLEAGPIFKQLYDIFVKEYDPEDRLFEMLPQSVNKMTERVALNAGIDKSVSPQTLRDTFAVDTAAAGADEAQLLDILGLAPDARNRMSVQRYIDLASPPVNARFSAVK